MADELRRSMWLEDVGSHGLPTAPRDPAAPVYLRIGIWNPKQPRSHNYAIGDVEAGLSVYDLDADGQPIVPRKSALAGLGMRTRLSSDDPKFLVQGRVCGQGYDGEPLLWHPVVVGLWPA